mmetsp:Transcript_51939/g.118459  ORF Transcript_51939/g.118459 Transcript_51939/m.118459 type:complete len:202 (+) Transcript_51939:1061-1666(+)
MPCRSRTSESASPAWRGRDGGVPLAVPPLSIPARSAAESGAHATRRPHRFSFALLPNPQQAHATPRGSGETAGRPIGQERQRRWPCCAGPAGRRPSRHEKRRRKGAGRGGQGRKSPLALHGTIGASAEAAGAVGTFARRHSSPDAKWSCPCTSSFPQTPKPGYWHTWPSPLPRWHPLGAAAARSCDVQTPPATTATTCSPA